MWGSANASPVTLSFWVRSSVTGNFPLVLMNGNSTRSYGTTYTINAANTFEYKTITILGDTTGTWATDNTAGIAVIFGFGGGSGRTVSAGWGAGAAATATNVTGATQLIATNGATFYITGVQLEAGTVATPFEHRSYGDELRRCQRYFQYFPAGAVGQWNSSTVCELGASYPVEMRATPTASVNPNDADCLIFRMGVTTNPCTVSSVSSNYLNKNGGVIGVVVSSASTTPALGDNAAYDPDGDSYVFFLSSEL